MFKSTEIDLGTVKQHKEIEVSFPYENIQQINTLKSSCGCGMVYDRKGEQRVLVKYTPQEVPFHLIQQGVEVYDTAKWVDVNFTPQGEPTTMDVKLIFRAKVCR